MKLFSRARNCLLAMLASSLLGCVPAHAAEGASEAAVRVALLFNFIKFTEWPATANSPQLQVCVSSSDAELLATMETLNTRQVRGQSLTTARFTQQAGCDVVYVDTRQAWSHISDRKLPPHALTIGSYAGFTAEGGMIEIALQDGNVRFDINLNEARRAGLRLYPQLLKLARRVVE